jgi:hypothetical protein
VDLTLRIILAVVLLWAAAAKLRAPGRFAAALADHGVPARLRRATASAVVAAEVVLAAGLLIPSLARLAGAGVAVLGAAFAASLLRLRLRGVREAGCACFGGARSRPVGWLVARAAVLAVAGALVATGALERPAPDGAVLVGAALAVLALCVAVLTVLVLALYRQVGVLESRLGPRAALELADEGPPLGAQAPALEGLERIGPELVAFGSPGCRLCAEIEPALDALARGGLPVRAVDEGRDPETFRRFRVPGTPYVAYVVDGVVTAKGLVNTLEQIEELIATGDDRLGASPAAA